MNKTNWLANIFEWIGITFERFNPAAFRFLSAVLPYTTPIPVAVLTASSTQEFLGFVPLVSGIFVFGLEGMGLWFTSLLVDGVVEWIKSRNWKSFSLVILFALVVSAYIYLLVNLNVTLETASGDVNPVLSRVITLLCFLPLLTGVGNGYYKLKLESKDAITENKQYEREKEERIRQEKREDKLRHQALKQGINVFALDEMQNAQNTANPVQNAHTPMQEVAISGDWRVDEGKLGKKQLLWLKDAPINSIMIECNLKRRTAFDWKNRAKIGRAHV